jgi:hypothetical protein
VTAAQWLPGGDVCIGTSVGTCHLFSPSRPSGSRGRQPPSVPKEPALELHQYRDAVSAFCVLGAADTAAAPDAAAALLCVLVATRSSLLAITGAGAAAHVLRASNSASTLAQALALEVDRGARCPCALSLRGARCPCVVRGERVQRGPSRPLSSGKSTCATRR